MLACSACTAGEPPPTQPPAAPGAASPGPTPRSSAAGSQVALRSTPVDGYMDSALRGTLAVITGCVAVQTSGGPVTPVFGPGDVDWDGATLTLLASGHTYRVGDAIRLGGGPMSRTRALLPPGCPNDAWSIGPS